LDDSLIFRGVNNSHYDSDLMEVQSELTIKSSLFQVTPVLKVPVLLVDSSNWAPGWVGIALDQPAEPSHPLVVSQFFGISCRHTRTLYTRISCGL
jgi:hypothetical protein